MQASNKLYSSDKLYDSLTIAFEHLEKEVKRGRIASFGIASNTMHLQTAPDHLSLQRILENPTQNFKSIQFPFNVYESEAALEGFDGSPSLVQQCRENNIFTMTQRTFIAITKNGVRNLATRGGDVQANEKAMKIFESLTEMEVDLAMNSTL